MAIYKHTNRGSLTRLTGMYKVYNNADKVTGAIVLFCLQILYSKFRNHNYILSKMIAHSTCSNFEFINLQINIDLY